MHAGATPSAYTARHAIPSTQANNQHCVIALASLSVAGSCRCFSCVSSSSVLCRSNILCCGDTATACEIFLERNLDCLRCFICCSCWKPLTSDWMAAPVASGLWPGWRHLQEHQCESCASPVTARFRQHDYKR